MRDTVGFRSTNDGHVVLRRLPDRGRDVVQSVLACLDRWSLHCVASHQAVPDSQIKTKLRFWFCFVKNLSLRPTFYRTRTETKTDYYYQFWLHLCRSPTESLSPTNMDFIFEDSMTSQGKFSVFMNPSTSSKVLVQQYHFISDDAVQKRVLHSRRCLAVSGFAAVLSTFSTYMLYVWTRAASCDDRLRIMENNVACASWRTIWIVVQWSRRNLVVTVVQQTVDHGWETIDSVLEGAHIFHLTNVIDRPVVFFSKRTEIQKWPTNLCLSIVFVHRILYAGGADDWRNFWQEPTLYVEPNTIIYLRQKLDAILSGFPELQNSFKITRTPDSMLKLASNPPTITHSRIARCETTFNNWIEQSCLRLSCTSFVLDLLAAVMNLPFTLKFVTSCFVLSRKKSTNVTIMQGMTIQLITFTAWSR